MSRHIFVKRKKASAGGLTTVSVFTTASVGHALDPNPLTIPATVQAGDVLVMYVHAFGSSNPGIAVPAGWTAITDLYNNLSSWTTRVQIYYKIATALDAGASVSTVHASWEALSRMMAVVRGNVPITGVTVGDVDKGSWTSSSAGSPAAQTCDATAQTAPVMVFGTYAADSAVSPRYFNISGVDAKDGEFTNPTTGLTPTNLRWMAYKSFDSGGVALAPVVIDIDDEGNNMFLTSWFMKFVG